MTLGKFPALSNIIWRALFHRWAELTCVCCVPATSREARNDLPLRVPHPSGFNRQHTGHWRNWCWHHNRWLPGFELYVPADDRGAGSRLDTPYDLVHLDSIHAARCTPAHSGATRCVIYNWHNIESGLRCIAMSQSTPSIARRESTRTCLPANWKDLEREILSAPSTATSFAASVSALGNCTASPRPPASE